MKFSFHNSIVAASDYDVSHYVFFIECNAGVKLTEVHESQVLSATIYVVRYSNSVCLEDNVLV